MCRLNRTPDTASLPSDRQDDAPVASMWSVQLSLAIYICIHAESCQHHLVYVQLFQLQSGASESPLTSQVIHQFQGGSTCRLLSRSRLIQRPEAEGKILAAFGDEATKSVCISNYMRSHWSLANLIILMHQF